MRSRKFIAGRRMTESIKVAWPNGWTEPDDLGNSQQSSDPNDHFRPYLERMIGVQGWDWDWFIAPDGDAIEIRVLPEHQRHLTHLSMVWKTV